MRKRSVIICGLIVLALGVRFLTWQDNRRDIWKVQTSVTDGYKDSARQLASGDFRLFASDINHMGHPPGYSILLAAIFKTLGESDTAIQVVQILFDCVAVVLVFLIAAELAPLGGAVLCGFLAAISPQFAYFPIVLLPDSLVVPPILLAIWLLIRDKKTPRLANFAIAGAFIGLSCWFRANALFLPFILALLTPLFVARGKRLHAAAALVAGALLTIAPITIKNAIVFRSFIPLSLGAGQTFLEGIADYDEAKRFNIPNTDLGLMRQEAEWYGNPEYAQLLFGRDGIKRDRMRIERGLAVVRSHPVWFAGVVAKRGLASTRLDPVPALRPASPVSHDIPVFDVPELERRLEGGSDKYSDLYVSEEMAVKPNTDYVLLLAIKLERGRVQIKITDAQREYVLASTQVDLVEGVNDQPGQHLTIPFVSGSHTQVRVVVSNFASENSSVLIGTSPGGSVELGPSSYQWLRYVRQPLGFLQRFFKTAWVLPFVVIGVFLMVRKRDWQSLAILLAVPAYYLVVQSTLHTERRYVYIIHFFFLILASDALCKIATRGFLVLSSSFSLFFERQPKG